MRDSINVYTKWQKTAAKDYSYYFHEALERISFIETNFYKSLAEIEVIDRSILLVNWPEEILAWSIGKSNAQEAIHNLRKLKKDGLRILYVWHNTRPTMIPRENVNCTTGSRITPTSFYA